LTFQHFRSPRIVYEKVPLLPAVGIVQTLRRTFSSKIIWGNQDAVRLQGDELRNFALALMPSRCVRQQHSKLSAYYVVAFVALSMFDQAVSVLAASAQEFRFRRCTVCSPGCPSACRLGPGQAGSPQPPLLAPGEVAFKKGEELFDNGEYDQALPWFEKAVTEAPDNSKYQDILLQCRREISIQKEKAERAAELRKLQEHLASQEAETLNQGIAGQSADAISGALRNLPPPKISGVNLGIPIVQRTLEGAPPLPTPTWECYCEYRYVTRPNGKTYPQIIRTPEQQRAFESRKALDNASAELTRARDKFFATWTPLESAEWMATKKIAMDSLIALATAGSSTVKDIGEAIEAAVNNLGKLKIILEAAEKADTAQDLLKRSIEWYQARDELYGRGDQFVEALKDWSSANERAKNVPSMDHVLSQPFTMVFTFRAGQDVAIIRRSRDQISRGITPREEVSIGGSWDGK
jgi:tetratricopeptide (TPR) repeat protein